MTPGLSFGFLPEAIHQVRTWNTIRVDELRLKMTEGFESYNCAIDCEEYYAYNILYWTNEWLDLKSDHRVNVTYIKLDDAEKALHWYSLIPEFYQVKDDAYYQSLYKIADMYRLKSECQIAIPYYDEVYNNFNNLNFADIALRDEANCYLKLQNSQKAFEILQSIETSSNYRLSKILLAELYFQMGQSAEAVALLKNQENLDEYALFVFGKAKIETGDIDTGVKTLEKNLGHFEQIKDFNNLADSYLWLGEGYFRQSKYFESAESYYKGLSLYLMYAKNVSEKTYERFLPNYLESIKTVQVRNSADNRLDLWLFTYYIFTPNEKDNAWDYFTKHLDNGSGYEPEFTNWIIEQVKKQK